MGKLKKEEKVFRSYKEYEKEFFSKNKKTDAEKRSKLNDLDWALQFVENSFDLASRAVNR